MLSCRAVRAVFVLTMSKTDTRSGSSLATLEVSSTGTTINGGLSVGGESASESVTLTSDGIAAMSTEFRVSASNLFLGSSANSVGDLPLSTVVMGGSAGEENRAFDDHCVILGGLGNVCGLQDGLSYVSARASVMGGRMNTAEQLDSVIAGGEENYARGQRS